MTDDWTDDKALRESYPGHDNQSPVCATWQPIETAPRDGTWFLAYSPGGDWRRLSWGINHFGRLCWCSATDWWPAGEGEVVFTYWMSLEALPKPPNEPRQEGGES